MKYELGNALRQIAGLGRYKLSSAIMEDGMYPVDLQFTLKSEEQYYRPRDHNGIPVKAYKSVGRQYNPTRIAAYGLANYNAFLNTNSDVCRNEFVRMANWFMATTDGRWFYDFDWGTLRAPWLSCMAQGEGISVLTRAYKLTGERRYLDLAIRALAPLCQEIGDGGVRSALPDGSPFLEEYPMPMNPSHTLNGFLYALIGITDLASVSPEAVKQVELDALVASLSDNIHLWDVGGWSAYDIENATGRRNYATLDYHTLHTTQLKYLGLRLENEVFIEQATRWQKAAASPIRRMVALYGKLKYRLMNPPQR